MRFHPSQMAPLFPDERCFIWAGLIFPLLMKMEQAHWWSLIESKLSRVFCWLINFQNRIVDIFFIGLGSGWNEFLMEECSFGLFVCVHYRLPEWLQPSWWLHPARRSLAVLLPPGLGGRRVPAANGAGLHWQDRQWRRCCNSCLTEDSVF